MNQHEVKDIKRTMKYYRIKFNGYDKLPEDKQHLNNKGIHEYEFDESVKYRLFETKEGANSVGASIMRGTDSSKRREAWSEMLRFGVYSVVTVYKQTDRRAQPNSPKDCNQDEDKDEDDISSADIPLLSTGGRIPTDEEEWENTRAKLRLLHGGLLQW